MDKKLVVGVIVIILVFIGSLFYFFQDEKTECDILREMLDDVASESGTISAQYGMQPEDVEIGGVLIKIKFLGPNLSVADDLDSYLLNFMGKERRVALLLTTTSGNVLPYSEGNFYVFNQKEIRASGYHSGEFIDRDMDKLKEIDC